MRLSIVLKAISNDSELEFFLSNGNFSQKLKLLCRRIIRNKHDRELVNSCITYGSAEIVFPFPMTVISLGNCKISESVTVCCSKFGKCKSIRKDSFDAEVSCNSIGNLYAPSEEYRSVLHGILNRHILFPLGYKLGIVNRSVYYVINLVKYFIVKRP